MPATVILVHGLRTSATLWRHQVEHLERLGIPTSAIDLPGHGRRLAERFTLDAALKSIDDAVTAAEASGSKPYLVGFSLALNDFAVRLFVPQPGATDVVTGGVALEVMDDVIRILLALQPVERLREIDVPVLFINGRYDHVSTHARRYLDATRNGRLVTVPGASHMVSVVRPHQFTDAMLEGYAQATG